MGMGTVITPAAQRLQKWFVDESLLLLDRADQDLSLEEAQEIVDVVLNMPETPDLLIGRMAGALRQTLTMMTGDEKQWDKLARQIVLRAGLETAERNGSE